MFINPKVGGQLVNIKTNERAEIIKVNAMYGWFKVRFKSGKEKIYTMNVAGENLAFNRYNAEEKADWLLAQENSRVSDSWWED